MAKEIELRRHTDSDGDSLTEDGVQAALEIGAKLRGSYELLARRGHSAPPRPSPALPVASASGCRAAWWSSRASDPKSRTAGAGHIRRLGAANSAHSARPTPNWSKGAGVLVVLEGDIARVQQLD